MVQKTIAQLRKEAQQLGVKPSRFTGPGGKDAKRDWVAAIRGYHLSKDFPDGILPWGLQQRITIEEPLKGILLTNLPQEKQREVLRQIGTKYFADEKYNGMRLIHYYGPDGSYQAFSGNLSVTNYYPAEYTDKSQPEIRLPEGISAVFDSEAICLDSTVNTSEFVKSKGVITGSALNAAVAIFSMDTAASLAAQKKHRVEFRVFDIIMWKGQDLRSQPFRVRRALLEKIAPLAFGSNVKIAEPANFDEVIARKGEGVMVKHLDGKYLTNGSRRPEVCIKMKRSMASAMSANGVGDTIDAFVTGFSLGEVGSGFENLIGSLDLSIILVNDDGTEYQHLICRAPNIPLEDRKKMTVNNGEGPTLDKKWMGQVFEVDGQAISPKALRLTHPRILRHRPDKSADQCIMMKSEMMKHVGL